MELLRLKAASLLRINILILFCIWISGCSYFENKKEILPFYNTADFTAEWIEHGDAKYNSIHTIDTFTMYNQLGHVFTSDSFHSDNVYRNIFVFLVLYIIISSW